MYSLNWLAKILKEANLKVIEEPNWKNRGRGEFGTPKGVMLHHTAGSLQGNTPSLNVVLNGRPDLPGPLSQLLLARDGTYHVLAAGRCSHAGRGVWQGVSNGNAHFIGIEAENTGLSNDLPWPEIQMAAYARGVAAIINHIQVPVIMCVGHKEYALPKGRKIDPTFDMDTFRTQVSTLIDNINTKVTNTMSLATTADNLLPIISYFYPQSAPAISILQRMLPMINKVAPAVSVAIQEGPNAYEAVRKASPKLANYIDQLTESLLKTGSAMTTTRTNEEFRDVVSKAVLGLRSPADWTPEENKWFADMAKGDPTA